MGGVRGRRGMGVMREMRGVRGMREMRGVRGMRHGEVCEGGGMGREERDEA